ncbi:protein LTO1 homolog [Tribolium madens]|uniref:protein LTO1 homolog n=1 Tax=Tribolium madens TaxID=41895 RepID=UPI001CF74A2F|nr:protein LTO1 homolog [Tribolium madens]
MTDESEKDINDAFSDILLSEDRIFENSYNEGYELGKQEENIEAFHLGYHRGAELGAEIGYYTSIASSYLTFHQGDKSGDDKIVKELETLRDMLDSFPRENDPNVDILELMGKIRAKFKKICAVLKIQPPFPESDKLSF